MLLLNTVRLFKSENNRLFTYITIKLDDLQWGSISPNSNQSLSQNLFTNCWFESYSDDPGYYFPSILQVAMTGAAWVTTTVPPSAPALAPSSAAATPS